jgi:putative peptide zinc metalloprotease protein
MDGQRTVHDISRLLEANDCEQAPTPDELAQLIAQLHKIDAIQCEITPDLRELLDRGERQSRRQWHHRLNPLSSSFKLFDPDRLLTTLLSALQPLHGWRWAVLWIGIVGYAALQAAIHWSELTHDVIDRILTPQNIAVLWLLFPVLKIFHELGHGLATKIYGGDVREIGVLLFALQPVPYVDASAASLFRSKWQRILVGAAGMIVELFIAALALFVWLNTEPGMIRNLAYNVVFIAGVSTVVFNANPFLRYDGYYMLADYLELPNLRARSYRYMQYLCERYLFGRADAISDTATRSERFWLASYAIAGPVYRVMALGTLMLFIAGKFFFIGVLLALFGAIIWILLPFYKMLFYLFKSPTIRSVRSRALTMSAFLVLTSIILLFWVPLPLSTRAEGVISIPDQARLRAATDCFVDRIVAAPGSQVGPDQALIICSDPQLSSRVKVLEARLEELETRYVAQWLIDIRQAQIIKDEMSHVQEQLARARERVADLIVRSRTAGVVEIPDAASLPGRFVQKGAPFGYVLDQSALTARVVVPDAAVELVRNRSWRVYMRLVDRPDKIFATVIRREVPAGDEKLPSRALGTQGGGAIVVDPVNKDGVKSVEKIFQFDLALPASAGIHAFGGRVYVRFDHGWEPIAIRWYRALRQLLLSSFHV